MRFIVHKKHSLIYLCFMNDIIYFLNLSNKAISLKIGSLFSKGISNTNLNNYNLGSQ